MNEELTKEQLKESSPDFADALLEAEKLSTDDLFKKFNDLKYESFGHGAVMLYKYQREEVWDSGLRNDVNWKEPKLRCIGKTPKEALVLLYAWCIHKGYLKIK